MQVVMTFIATFFLTVCMLFGGIIQPSQASNQQEKIAILVDGLPITTETQPVVQNGRVLIPFRAVAEALNVAVTWDSASATISAQGGGNSVKLKINSINAEHNNNLVSLDVPPLIIDARTMIPLRFFSEAFGCTVSWDNTTHQQIKITSPPRAMTITGFYALGDQKTSSWENLFGTSYPQTSTGHTDVVSELALGWYTMDREGNLLTVSNTGWQRPGGWEKVLEAANKYRLNTEMVIHLTDNNAVLFDFLNDQTAVDKAINAIRAEATLYQGVNLDFEELGLTGNEERLMLARNNFTRFVRLLAGQLKEDQLQLTLTLHPPNSAYKGYDYQALGQIADRVIIMAYEYGTRPEPVAKVVEAVEMAQALIPTEKLVLGISTPSETSESFVTKVDIAKRYNLNGIALWRLGLVSNEMWNGLKQSVQKKEFSHH